MRIHPWNALLTLFFAALVAIAVWWLFAANRVFYDVPFRDLLLIALATFRLTRLFTYDVITKFMRDWFVGTRENSLPHTLGVLLNCPWCTGLWFSFLVVFFYFATPFAWPVIILLALAGLASFFMIVANLVSWTAEAKKLEVLSRKGE